MLHLERVPLSFCFSLRFLFVYGHLTRTNYSLNICTYGSYSSRDRADIRSRASEYRTLTHIGLPTGGSFLRLHSVDY